MMIEDERALTDFFIRAIRGEGQAEQITRFFLSGIMICQGEREANRYLEKYGFPHGDIFHHFHEDAVRFYGGPKAPAMAPPKFEPLELSKFIEEEIFRPTMDLPEDFFKPTTAPTKTQRLTAVKASARSSITASEANEFLRSLPESNQC